MTESVSPDRTPAYGASLRKVEPYGTEEIPDSERHGHPRSQFTLWFAANMVLAVLVSGFFSASFGLTVFEGLSAVAVGSLAGSLVMGVLAGIGTRLGVPQQVQARGPMGYFANFVPIALLTNVSAIGWVAVNTVFAVIALQVLVDIPFWAGAIILFVLQSLFAIWGHNVIHLVNKIASAVLAVLFAVITVLALTKVDFGSSVAESLAPSEGGFASWITFAGFFFAYVMTWTPFASDFSRYLPRTTSHARVVAYTSGGSFLAMLWLGGVGVLVSSFAGSMGAIEAVAELTGNWSWLAMATVVLSTIPVSAMNLYGGALSLLTIRVPVGRKTGVVITAVLSLGVTLLMQTNPYGSFYDFLLLLAYLVVPFSTVLLLDYFLRTRSMGEAAVAELFDTRRFVSWGFYAWGIGCVVSAMFWTTNLWTGPLAPLVAGWGDVSYYIGALTSTIAYLSIYYFTRRGTRSTDTFATPSTERVPDAPVPVAPEGEPTR